MTKMRDLISDGEGPLVPDVGEPIYDTLRLFLDDCRERGRRDKTVIWYEAKLREMFKNIIDRPVSILTDPNVAEICQVVRMNKSPETSNGYLRALKRFLNFAVEMGRLEHTNPRRIKIKKTDDKMPTILTQDEIRRLLESFDEHDIFDLRNKTITQLLLDTGVRIGECLGIRMEDIDLPVITLRFTKGRVDRQVRMSEEMMSLMKRWLRIRRRAGEEGFLFPSAQSERISISRYSVILKQQAAKAGITKNVHPHVMRFTFISALNAARVDVESIRLAVGHKTPHMVLHYATVMPTAALEAAATTSPIAQLSKTERGNRQTTMKGQKRKR